MSTLTVEKHWSNDGLVINVGSDGGYVMIESVSEGLVLITAFNKDGDVVLEEERNLNGN
jgi:hypothetical protein